MRGRSTETRCSRFPELQENVVEQHHAWIINESLSADSHLTTGLEGCFVGNRGKYPQSGVVEGSGFSEAYLQAMLAWKLKVDTSKIFNGQGAVVRKQRFRRLMLWCEITLRRFGRADFFRALYLAFGFVKNTKCKFQTRFFFPNNIFEIVAVFIRSLDIIA